MAHALAVNDVLLVQLVTQDNEQTALNNFHFVVDTVGALAATDQDFANTLDSAVQAAVKPILNSGATYKGVVVQKIFPAPPYPSQFSTTGAGLGTGGATALPRQSAGFTKWITGMTGRHGHGRTYWPFPSTTDNQVDGVPTAAYIAKLSTLSNVIFTFAALAAGGRTATVSLVLWDRVGHLSTLVTTFALPTKFATQRRRGSFGRPNPSPI